MADARPAALIVFVLVLMLVLVPGESQRFSPVDPCTTLNSIVSGGLFARPSQTLACLRSFPYNATRAKQVTTSLIKLFSLHAFKDISRNSPTPELPLKVDVIQGLTTIAATTYPDDFSFHRELYRLVNSLNDGHAAYVPYCYAGDQLGVYSAFPLVSVEVRGRQVIQVAPAASTYIEPIKTATEALMRYKVKDYDGAEVVEINGLPALVYADRMAETVGIYKDKNARFNALFAHYDAGGSVRLGNLADRLAVDLDDTNDLTFLVRRVGSTALERITVPLFVTFNGLPFANRNEYYAQFCYAEAGPEFPSVRPKTAAAEPTTTTTTTSSAPATAPAVKEHEKKMWRMRMLARPRPQPFATAPKSPAPTAAEPGPGAGAAKAQAAGAKPPPPRAARPPGSEATMVRNGLYIQAYLLQDGITGVMTVPDFLGGFMGSYPGVWQEQVFLAITSLKAFGATRLIIDLSDNPGGYGTLPTSLLNYLFPNVKNVEYPSQFVSTPFADRILNRTLKRLQDSTELLSSPMLYTWFGLVFPNRTEYLSPRGFFYPLRQQTFGGVRGSYSALFALLERNSSPYGLGPPNDLLKPLADKQPEFAAENVLILTNGLCFSSCATFTYGMAEFAGVRTVAVGGLLGKPMTFSSGLVGMGYSLQGLTDYDIPFAGMERDPDAPKALPVQAKVGWVPALAYCKANETVPGDFVFKPATIRIPFTEKTVMNRSALWDQVARYF